MWGPITTLTLIWFACSLGWGQCPQSDESLLRSSMSYESCTSSPDPDSRYHPSHCAGQQPCPEFHPTEDALCPDPTTLGPKESRSDADIDRVLLDEANWQGALIEILSSLLETWTFLKVAIWNPYPIMKYFATFFMLYVFCKNAVFH